MRKTPALLAAALVAVALVPGASAKRPAPKHHAAKPAPKATSAWAPDPKQLDGLDAPRTFGDYLLRFPKGFQSKEKVMDEKYGTAATCIASGPKRADGSVPFLVLVNGHAGEGGVALSVDTLMKGADLPRDQAGFVETDTQDGSNGSLDMSRRYFKFPDPSHTGKFMHGFLYATTDSHSNCVVMAADEEPYSATTLPLLEAAALTLRKP